MASKPVAQASSVSTNLQRTFENAVRDIHPAEGKGPNHRMPIVQRARMTVESAGNVQEKALADAAKALAQLWKVSPNSQSLRQIGAHAAPVRGGNEKS